MNYNPFDPENTPVIPTNEEPEAAVQEPAKESVAPSSENDAIDTAASDIAPEIPVSESEPAQSISAEAIPEPTQEDPYSTQDPAQSQEAASDEAANHAPYYHPAAEAPKPNSDQPQGFPGYYPYMPQAGAPGQAPPQGYYYMPYSMQPSMPPAPPKRKKSATAFLVIMWVLIGVFSIGFFSLCGYIIGNSGGQGSTAPTLFEEEPGTSAQQSEPASSAPEEDDSHIIPMPDSDKNEYYSGDASISLKKLPTDKDNAAKYTTQYAYKKVAKSTIGVVCYEAGFSGDDPASQGTGIVLTEDGYVATNSHVIGDSRSRYDVRVVVSDGTIYEAKVIGYDTRTDLAVLKINAKNLTPAEFCDSKYAEVGQDVIAVGNPGGIEFQNSLTRGVVSALDRELSLSAQVSYIQTDAAINPGNSGGPLCNMYGQVIGINTAKISASSYEGMGFAIPSATVKEIVDDLTSQGYVNNRVRLGISGQEVSSQMQQYYGIPKGILIGEIAKDGPCDGTGIMVNDVLTKMDDTEITTFAEVFGILAEHKPGDKVKLTLYRMDTQETIEVTVTLMADQGETQQ
ncbi:MAG: trypsin-like peptidase domain-containing protein [Ruminococcus sp.]|nr:trypsin-like peptidase domain-containing protein [Ruminococcus sp.]